MARKKAVEKEELKIESQTFENALAELEKIVNKLEDGDAPLEQALGLYEEGVQLSRFCQKELQTAEHRVMKLEDDGKKITATPFNDNNDEEDDEWDDDEEEADDDDEDDEDEDLDDDDEDDDLDDDEDDEEIEDDDEDDDLDDDELDDEEDDD